jgi:thiamine pyrophosphate-dependent acetolactate synthase large subunit-like protein
VRVYEALARAFVAEGTRGVFTMMGDANMYWLNALSKLGVQLYDVRHEGAGLAMADGWGRVTGEPGVCSTTSGPGTTQIATSIVVAARARTPLVAFCGDTASGQGHDAQTFDQARFAAAVEAAYVRLERPEAAYAVVGKAFELARTESRPVVLGAPQDVQMAAFVEEDEYVASSVVEAPPDLDEIALEAAADVVQQSARPILLLGRGALAADAGAAALGFAERSGALVATTLHAKNWLNDAPFHLGIAGGYGTRTARELLRSADCLVAAGASVSSYTSDAGTLFESAKIVQIDCRADVPMGDRRPPVVYLHGDARTTLERLTATLERRGHSSSGLRTDDVRSALARSFDDDYEVELEPGTVDPRAACMALDEAIPPQVGLVLGSGQQIRFPTMLMRRQRAYIVAQHHFGCIGQGLTTLMGAVCATGEPAFTVEGDAGLMMHLAELETAVRYRLPVLVVVMNDEALGAEFHKSRSVGLDERLALISTPDLGAVARSFGAAGSLARSVDDLVDAARAWAANPGPALIDVRISRSVLSIPYRRARGEDA